MQDMPIAAYADDPIYNMKAVTQRTGIPAATLRAWERRYNALAPRRSEGNYRLYSERDVAILRWLQAQLDAGLTISRAVALLERLREQHESATLPASDAAEPSENLEQRPHSHAVANWQPLTASLYNALVSMDEQQAAQALAEAFALYPVNDVCNLMFAPVLVAVGDAWFNGKITVVQEHFASTYLMGRLLMLFNSLRLGQGPLILVGCAPGEQHTIGALMLALLLRRAGHNVRYLGPDVPLADLLHTIVTLRPQVVALSAGMPAAVDTVQQLPQMLRTAGADAQVIFGGRGFSDAQASHEGSLPYHIGADLNSGIELIERLLEPGLAFSH